MEAFTWWKMPFMATKIIYYVYRGLSLGKFIREDENLFDAYSIAKYLTRYKGSKVIRHVS